MTAVIHVVLLTWLIAWGRGLYGCGLLGLATASKERKQNIHVNGSAMFLILDGLPAAEKTGQAPVNTQLAGDYQLAALSTPRRPHS